jgi:iron complex outermembrane receptor protein
MKFYFRSTLYFLLGSFAPFISAQSSIEEMVVTSDFRATSFMDATTSLTLVDAETIEARSATQLEEILNLAPNVNFAAGASRGRYMQIRGIGERSQFIDPISPSVGLVIDGVDFSSMGNAALLFDIDQVEVLRGPQGTRYGSSGLAGLVNIRSAAPSDDTVASLNLGRGNYGRSEIGGVVGGALSPRTNGRLAFDQTRSDGFIENTFLNSNTQDRNEAALRGRLNWQPGSTLNLDFIYLFLNVENGYDAFSLDNNRETLSDQPGQDNQRSNAFSLISSYTGSSSFDIELTTSVQNTAAEYSYDEDWTNTSICEGLACDSDDWGFDWWYSSTDNYRRNLESYEINTRLLSKVDSADSSNWVAGLFFKRNEESLRRTYFEWTLFTDGLLRSSYITEELAVYGEYGFALSDSLRLTLGGRAESLDAEYSDSRAIAASPSEFLWGAEANLRYDFSEGTTLYGLISRGFKPGGVNGSALYSAQISGFSTSVVNFLNDRLEYETETALNFEAGIRNSGENWLMSLSAFHMKRDQVQLKGWYNEGTDFVGYTDNGASGTNTGVEAEGKIWPTDNIEIFASLGLLSTEIEDFYIFDGANLVDKSGRDQAHAPFYQFNLGAEVALTESFTARVEVDGKDKFYFSDSHDQTSEAFSLVHARLAYQLDNLQVSLWGRNLTDEAYEVRGFYFPNDPRDCDANGCYIDDEAYTQLGEPRTFGLGLKYSF